MNHRELVHKWAHATADQSRRSGSLSFTGDTLYSYATPIAKIYRKRDGSALALLSNHSYSMTTAKHIGYAFGAVSHMPAMRAPRYIVGIPTGAGRYGYSVSAKEDHKANLSYFAAAVADALKKAQRSQTVRAVEWWRNDAERAIEYFRLYAAHFGVRRKLPVLDAAAWQAATDRARRLEHPDPASLDKRERAKARKIQAEYASKRLAQIDRELGLPDYSEMARRSDWRLYGAFNAHSYPSTVRGPVMLRLCETSMEECIETSLGARVPVAAAPMVWQLVKNARACGGIDSSSNANTIRMLSRRRIGDYPLDRIDADGTLHAGCHTIPYSELASMARALGLEGGESRVYPVKSALDYPEIHRAGVGAKGDRP